MHSPTVASRGRGALLARFAVRARLTSQADGRHRKRAARSVPRPPAPSRPRGRRRAWRRGRRRAPVHRVTFESSEQLEQPRPTARQRLNSLSRHAIDARELSRHVSTRARPSMRHARALYTAAHANDSSAVASRGVPFVVGVLIYINHNESRRWRRGGPRLLGHERRGDNASRTREI